MENQDEIPDEPKPERSYLRRLHPEAYRGYAYVHWSMTLEDRKQGWLGAGFHWQFREILTHTASRYHLTRPLYCLMPDHWHLLWIGVHPDSDQRLASKFFRRHTNRVLDEIGPYQLQRQAYDNVLREKDRTRDAFAVVASYIRSNPLRARLVSSEEELDTCPFTGCLLPGYPELSPRDDDFWDRFWRIHYRLQDSNPV